MNKIKNFINKRLIKNIPNLLTWTRIGSSVLAPTLFLMENIPSLSGLKTILALLGWNNILALFGCNNITASLVLYLYGAVSDLLDGFAARKLNASSEFGRKLDTVSDKLYAGSLLIPSILCGNLIMAIPLALELVISGINLKGQKKGIKTETQRIGKIKTVALFPTMIVGLLSTLDPAFLILLWPMMIVTTNLQYNSIITYNNVLNQKLEDSNNRVEVEIKEETKEDIIIENVKEPKKINFKYVWNKGKDLLDECAYYTMLQVQSVEKYKSRKKIR